ncbi:hypothetical protein PTKIN_Ptkin04bG0070700 [Pterospermum kingtungense]
MDMYTAARERVAYAKVCVEVDVSKSIHKTLTVVLEDGLRVQVLVETLWLPSKYSKCSIFGHSNRTCPKKKDGAEVQVWKPKQKFYIVGGSQDNKGASKQIGKAGSVNRFNLLNDKSEENVVTKEKLHSSTIGSISRQSSFTNNDNKVVSVTKDPIDDKGKGITMDDKGKGVVVDSSSFDDGVHDEG